MIRWTNNDAMGQFEGLLTGLSADDRDQAMALWSQDRIRRTNREARRRDAQHKQYVANLCWSIVTLVVVGAALLVAPLLDAPEDHMGPDEKRHLSLGRAIGGIE